MRKVLTASLATLLLSGPVLADPIDGLWKTEPDKGTYAHVKMGKCGSTICGVIVKTFKDGKETKSDTIGKRVVRDLTPQGGGNYVGSVWRPSNNKVYSGKINLKGDTMQLKGCVLGGLACGKQTWSRIQ